MNRELSEVRDEKKPADTLGGLWIIPLNETADGVDSHESLWGK